MTWAQSIFLAFLQGLTEPFPMSSLGHAVIVPALIGWDVNLKAPEFLPFITFLHLGTLFAFSSVFWRDWKAIFFGIFNSKNIETRAKAWRILFLLALATLPAVIIGGIFEHKIRAIFASPLPVSIFLLLNGLLLLSAYKFCKNASDPITGLEKKNILEEDLTHLNYKNVLIIGLWQCLALLPGFSRSGAAMIGGLTRKLSYYTAARISLLLAEPIILAATCKELLEMRHVPHKTNLLLQVGAGALVAGVTAYIAAMLLLKLFKKNNAILLKLFGIYCLTFGSGSALWFYFQ
ncbi:undecaprenyl-diphosphate phosphatase [Acetobacteraceae bacterium]|nr:undecaprenyl-diphosphate phosphatase [Acetobacteraceae bacterium]